MRHLRLPLVLGLAMVLAVGCHAGSSADDASDVPTANRNVSVNKDDYPVFPDADAGADPSVSADQGGKGFMGDGWQTNTSFDLVGDPHAVKGGLYRTYILDFPGTLRVIGPEHATEPVNIIVPLVYESLLNLNHNTLEFAPGLATHWQVSPDKMSFRFRINPNARFSDGQPVTADDVVATWTLYTDKDVQDPGNNSQFSKFEKPVAESKYIVSVKAKTAGWLNFYNFASAMFIFPASSLKSIDAAAYVRDYNYKMLPGSGPYAIPDADIHKGESISLRRRKDYWAEKTRFNTGMNNFDEIRLMVVRDIYGTGFEMFKKGDLDSYYVVRAADWVKNTDFDAIQRGLIQKRKTFNNIPNGSSGLAMNTRHAPLDDIRVRKALVLLFNRQQLIEKLYFNEYAPDNSYFPGGVYENPDDPKNDYDPAAAASLLADAGWKTRDAQGRLTKNGVPLAVEVVYPAKAYENFLTVYQEDLRKAGITLNLKLVTPDVQSKLVAGDRKFQMSAQAWRADAFPNPEVEYHSRLADVPNNNNLTGFKDHKIDELIDRYNGSFDAKERTAILRELDGVMTNLYDYVFFWYSPSKRLLYWNKFGVPASILTRTGDHETNEFLGPGPEQLWWFDPALAKKLDQAMKNPSIKLAVGAADNHYWQEYAKKAGN